MKAPKGYERSVNVRGRNRACFYTKLALDLSNI